MVFGEAISACFRKYVVFSGRAKRSEYWYWVLFQILLLIALLLADMAVLRNTGVLNAIASLALFLPSLAVTVRRLHDSAKSGWWILIILVPLVGSIVLLVMMCLRGTDGPNRFGPQPLDHPLETGALAA